MKKINAALEFFWWFVTSSKFRSIYIRHKLGALHG